MAQGHQQRKERNSFKEIKGYENINTKACIGKQRGKWITALIFINPPHWSLGRYAKERAAQPCPHPFNEKHFKNTA